MVKLSFYVPPSYLEAVKSAIFAAGGGQQGNYDLSCWQTLGVGQFRPKNGSQPFLGQKDKLEKVEEYKVEIICEESKLQAVIAALREAHPYEEPAFDCCQLLDLDT